jgi:enolase
MAEAIELRDGGAAWAGLGVLRAVETVKGSIARRLAGCNVHDQAAIDDAIIDLDGTPNFATLGSNAALGVSIACLRASALAQGVEVWQRVADLSGAAPLLPLPMVNILSGGLHARGRMDVQDMLAVPIGATSYDEALQVVCKVRDTAFELCAQSGLGTLLADEGGLAPPFADPRQGLELLMDVFVAAALEPGRDVAIALDVAAASLEKDGVYLMPRSGAQLSSDELAEHVADWARDFPIVSIEDPLGEEAWDAWSSFTKKHSSIQVVGDDLFATQPARIERGIACCAANAALVKLNQNGTVSGTIAAMKVAWKGGMLTIASARSGETEDDFLADFAVGSGAGQIKIGSVRTSERLAKYNRLSAIARQGVPWAGAGKLAVA